jgi:hypothetical protein
MGTNPKGVLMQKNARQRTLEPMRNLLAALVLILTCSSCANFAKGGLWNPVTLNPYEVLTIKAGASINAEIRVSSIGSLSFVSGSLAREFRNRMSSISFDGSNSVWVSSNDSARLGGASLPGGWSLNVGGSAVELQGYSSTTESANELTTVTRVSVGSHRVGLSLSVPGDTKPGAYKVSASINSRNGSIRLDWTVNVQ